MRFIKTDIQFIKEHYASKDETKALNDKIEDLHTEMHKQTETETKSIEEVADWMHEQKGYNQAIRDSKK